MSYEEKLEEFNLEISKLTGEYVSLGHEESSLDGMFSIKELRKIIDKMIILERLERLEK